jgi:hypothetical protein
MIQTRTGNVVPFQARMLQGRAWNALPYFRKPFFVFSKSNLEKYRITVPNACAIKKYTS